MSWSWLQSRTQFHVNYHFSRCASASASATSLDATELNKVAHLMKDKPQRLLYALIKGGPRLMGFQDAAYKNNPDGSSQRGQCVFICQPRNKGRDTEGSLIDYESRKIKRTVLSTTDAELHAFMKCYGSAQFYRGLWMDMTAQQPVEAHASTRLHSKQSGFIPQRSASPMDVKRVCQQGLPAYRCQSQHGW